MRPLASDRLAGKVAAVFGGGSSGSIGVGQAAAIAYASAGAKVAVIDLSLVAAQRTASSLAQAIAIEADITREADVNASISQVLGDFGKIDILHNNVGLPMKGVFTSFSMDDWVRGLTINCAGAANTMKAALPHLLKGRGCIINVSSIASIRHTGMNYAVYNASKAALDQLTTAVALEYASRGVRANSILPGLIDTAMGRGLAVAKDGLDRDDRSPTGKQGTVWDVASAAVYLASEEASYVNGHMLVVDGGLSRRC